jgi:hypothetical protein
MYKRYILCTSDTFYATLLIFMENIAHIYISIVKIKNARMINYALRGRVCGPQRCYDEYKNTCCYRNQVQTLSCQQNIPILTALPLPIATLYPTDLWTVSKLLDTSQTPSDEERRKLHRKWRQLYKAYRYDESYQGNIIIFTSHTVRTQEERQVSNDVCINVCCSDVWISA